MTNMVYQGTPPAPDQEASSYVKKGELYGGVAGFCFGLLASSKYLAALATLWEFKAAAAVLTTIAASPFAVGAAKILLPVAAFLIIKNIVFNSGRTVSEIFGNFHLAGAGVTVLKGNEIAEAISVNQSYVQVFGHVVTGTIGGQMIGRTIGRVLERRARRESPPSSFDGPR